MREVVGVWANTWIAWRLPLRIRVRARARVRANAWIAWRLPLRIRIRVRVRVRNSPGSQKNVKYAFV